MTLSVLAHLEYLRKHVWKHARIGTVIIIPPPYDPYGTEHQHIYMTDFVIRSIGGVPDDYYQVFKKVRILLTQPEKRCTFCGARMLAHTDFRNGVRGHTRTDTVDHIYSKQIWHAFTPSEETYVPNSREIQIYTGRGSVRRHTDGVYPIRRV